MKLYELREAYQDILNLDMEETDLTTALESLQDTVSEKAEGIAMILRQLEAEQEAYKAEIERLSVLKTKASNKQESLKKYLSDNLQAMQIDKLDTTLFKFSFRKSESVEIEDMTKINPKFIKIKTTESADKTAIKAAIKSGELVDGVTLQVNKNLQIK